MENMDKFGSVAFNFVLGYAERALKKSTKYVHGTIVNGEVVPKPIREKTDWETRLETTIAVLNQLMDRWNWEE